MHHHSTSVTAIHISRPNAFNIDYPLSPLCRWPNNKSTPKIKKKKRKKKKKTSAKSEYLEVENIDEFEPVSVMLNRIVYT